MKIIIQTPHVNVRQSLINFVRQKVGQLADVSNSLQEARITLKLDKAESKDSKTCEILGVIRGNDVFAEKRADSFDQAVIKAVEAINRQLTDRKADRNR
jgi:ribosomal subunit interface protein